jgi:prevent-host-death family protein
MLDPPCSNLVLATKGVTLVNTCEYSRGREDVLYRVGTRELKQHTGEIVERVRKGERVLLTLRGEPVAVIFPVDRRTIDEAIETEATRAERETLGWLAASETSFSFWDNDEDEVWDELAASSADQSTE